MSLQVGGSTQGLGGLVGVRVVGSGVGVVVGMHWPQVTGHWSFNMSHRLRAMFLQSGISTQGTSSLDLKLCDRVLQQSIRQPKSKSPSDGFILQWAHWSKERVIYIVLYLGF